MLPVAGDLHGDFDKTKRAFRLAGLTDQQDRWVGGDTVCVQVGVLRHTAALDRKPGLEYEDEVCSFLAGVCQAPSKHVNVLEFSSLI